MDELQKEMPEAVASASYSLISPNGFPLSFTLRQPTSEKLLTLMTAVEIIFTSQGYKPDIKRGFGRLKKPIETVPDRQCPTCGNPLVYFEAKGQKHIKCSTQKWDFTTKKATGCPYVEWADRVTQKDPRYTYRGVSPKQQNGEWAGQQIKVTGQPPASSADPSTTPTFDPATPAQITLIQTKCPQFYREGLSKQEATQIISQNLSK